MRQMIMHIVFTFFMLIGVLTASAQFGEKHDGRPDFIKKYKHTVFYSWLILPLGQYVNYNLVLLQSKRVVLDAKIGTGYHVKTNSGGFRYGLALNFGGKVPIHASIDMVSLIIRGKAVQAFGYGGGFRYQRNLSHTFIMFNATVLNYPKVYKPYGGKVRTQYDVTAWLELAVGYSF